MRHVRLGGGGGPDVPDQTPSPWIRNRKEGALFTRAKEKVTFVIKNTYSNWGHLVQTPQIPSGFKDKNSRALVVSWVFCFTQFV